MEDRVGLRVLENNSHNLSSAIDARIILPAALQKNLINGAERQKIVDALASGGPGQGMECLMQCILQRKRPNTFRQFLEVLDSCEDVKSWADYLRGNLTYINLCTVCVVV